MDATQPVVEQLLKIFPSYVVLILDMQEKVLNQDYMTWEEFEAELDKLLNDKLAGVNTGVTEAQVREIINGAISKLDLNTNGLTKAQVEKIIKNALKGLEFESLTKEEVEQIIKDLVNNWTPSDPSDPADTPVGEGGEYASIEDALAAGVTNIVLTSDMSANITDALEEANIDLGGNKLTLTNGLPIQDNGRVTLSNGEVESSQISVSYGARLVLDNVTLDTGNACAIFPMLAARVDISNSTIISDCPIGTNYSDDISRVITVNITNSTLGSSAEPCDVGIMMITSGNITVSNCTIYASGTGILDRAGNMTVKDTVIHYSPDADFSDTYFGSATAESTYNGKTPGSVRQMMWSSGSGGFKAPIVVGDFWAKHYSFDANCTLVNVTVNSTNATYPDVYLSQENYDIFVGANANNRVAGTEEIVKTTLTCDSTITWMVNPGKNDAFVDNCVDGMEHFAVYSGFGYSGSGYGGVAALYVDNVFVNGVEQAPGSTAESPRAAGSLAVCIPDFIATLAAGEYSVSVLDKVYPYDETIETYDYADEVIAALKADCGLELTREQLLSATLNFGSTKNALKSVTYTKDGVTTTKTVTGTGGRLFIDAISSLALTGSKSGSVLVKTIDTVSYLDVFKTYCEAHGITVTDSSKIVVGINNIITGVK